MNGRGWDPSLGVGESYPRADEWVMLQMTTGEEGGESIFVLIPFLLDDQPLSTEVPH
jgi:hypothetical protein